MVRLPDAAWRERAGLRHLLDVIGAAEGDTRYVGGCVRDTLLGLPVSDIDLATRLAPEQVLDRLKEAGIKAVPTGLAHGTVTAVLHGRPVEITTLRRDVTTDGRRATVAFTEDWRADAARRDFTINALSACPMDGTVFDYFGGLADLDARRVRFIGDPLERIAEDHLRILRFFRFHARFGTGGPDPAGLAACTARANDLMALSRERVADELLKLLAVADPLPTVVIMFDAGLFRPVLPEIAGTERLARLLAAEAEAEIAGDPLRRLAALLPPDAAAAASVASRLRLSNKAVRRLELAADPALDDPQVLAWRIGTEGATDRLLLAGQAAEAAALQGWDPPRLPLSGRHLIAMGLPPGPLVARTLHALAEDWARGGFAQDQESVESLARAHVDQALRVSQNANASSAGRGGA